MPMNGDDDPAHAVDQQVAAQQRRGRRSGGTCTPRRASGISAMMIKALKITAERMALCGVARSHDVQRAQLAGTSPRTWPG